MGFKLQVANSRIQGGYRTFEFEHKDGSIIKVKTITPTKEEILSSLAVTGVMGEENDYTSEAKAAIDVGSVAVCEVFGHGKEWPAEAKQDSPDGCLRLTPEAREQVPNFVLRHIGTTFMDEAQLGNEEKND